MMDMHDLTADKRELQERYLSLKKEYAELFIKKHEMQTYEENALTALYISTIGEKQHEIFYLRTQIAALKLKIELIQSYINRNEKPELKNVDQEIRSRFADFQKKLEDDARQLAAAKEFLKTSHFSQEEFREVKDTYRIIVKRLHPDLNPNLSEYESDLFIKAQAAYHLCNLTILREILLTLDLKQDSIATLTDLSELCEISEKLEKNVIQLRKQIEEMEQSFPFIYRDELRNQEWVFNTQKKLDEDIIELNKEKEKQTLYLKVIEEWKPGLTN